MPLFTLQGGAPRDARQAEQRTEILRWLALTARENLATEILLRERFGPGHELRALFEGGRRAVSLRSAGLWSLEADDAALARRLAADELPRLADPKLQVSGRVAGWILPTVETRFERAREHRLLAMELATAPPGRGRWATADDLPRLRVYEAAYNAERGTSTARDWPAAIAERQVAVLDEGGELAAVVCRSGETERTACLGGTWTFPEHRRHGLARALTGFLAGELLRERSTVHLIVDDDNGPALALYQSLGFEEIGTCHMIYLRRRVGPPR